MTKMHIIRDFIIAAVLGALALFLIGYVKNNRAEEQVPDEMDTEEETTMVTEEQNRDIVTGIVGTVFVGPQCPVETVEHDCPDAPFQGVVDIVFDDPERELIARVPTDQEGAFAASLPAGQYVIVVQHEGTFPVCGEEHVIVDEGITTDVAIICDSGIR